MNSKLFDRRPLPVISRSTITRISAALLCVGLLSSCAQEMSYDSRVKPYMENTFFEDGQSVRPLIENTVARGNLRTDSEFYTGKTNATADTLDSNDPSDTGQDGSESPQGTAAPSNDVQAQTTATPRNEQGGGTGEDGIATDATAAAEGSGALSSDLVTEMPFPVTEDVLARGQERYNAYCSPCHARTGYGDGMIVRRGLSQPPSFHDQRLIDAPVGHFYDVITNGYGRMYSYASRIRPVDRWAIVAYIRALQLSQNATIDDVPAQDRQQLQGGGG